MKIFIQWLRLLFSRRDLLQILRFNYKAYKAYKAQIEQKVAVAKLKGQTLDAIAKHKASAQDRCTHRKGGLIGHYDMGDSYLYAVIKHKHLWGDIWVRCTRCGKNWKPGSPDYETALKFPTDNQMSTSFQLTGPGLVERAREATRDTA